MLSAISKILETLSMEEGVKMVVLYRIDGVPLCAKLNVPKREIAPTLYWLEGQIKEMLYQISSQNLDEASFKFGNTVIMLYPVSRTTVLGIMADEETSSYKLDIDIKTSCKQIEDLVVSS